MIRSIPKDIWLRYESLLPDRDESGKPYLPKTLPYKGEVKGPFDYVLPEDLLTEFRVWLRNRGDRSVFYFLTEYVKGETTDFEVSVDELTQDNLAEINKGAENVIAAHDFTWALFVDAEGSVHVAGPGDLLSLLQGFQDYE